MKIKNLIEEVNNIQQEWETQLISCGEYDWDELALAIKNINPKDKKHLKRNIRRYLNKLHYNYIANKKNICIVKQSTRVEDKIFNLFLQYTNVDLNFPAVSYAIVMYCLKEDIDDFSDMFKVDMINYINKHFQYSISLNTLNKVLKYFEKNNMLKIYPSNIVWQIKKGGKKRIINTNYKTTTDCIFGEGEFEIEDKYQDEDYQLYMDSYKKNKKVPEEFKFINIWQECNFLIRRSKQHEFYLPKAVNEFYKQLRTYVEELKKR